MSNPAEGGAAFVIHINLRAAAAMTVYSFHVSTISWVKGASRSGAVACASHSARLTGRRRILPRASPSV